jgi:hypothetical protein
MTKISNQVIYKPDIDIVGKDYLIGTDSNQAKKTANFRIEDIGSHYNSVNGVRNFDFYFYQHQSSNPKPADGSFYANDNEQDPNNITDFYFSKITQLGKNVSQFFESISTENPFDLVIAQKIGVNSVIFFQIDNIEIFNSYYKLSVSEVFFPEGNGIEYILSYAIFNLKPIGNTTGNTNLGYIESQNQGTITSSTGTNAIIPLADGVNSGLSFNNLSDTLKTAYDSAVSWIATNATTLIDHISNTLNPHGVTKAQVGLSEADNTSDANKPVSIATQDALDLLDADDIDDTNTLHKFVDQNDLDILSTVLHSRATGLANGGFMTINTDTAKFDIADGFGYIVDGHTDVENPTTIKVTWTAKIAKTLVNIATQEATYIAIDSNGDVFQSENPLTSTERRDYIRLGIISHVNNTVISSINNQPTINIEVGAQVQDILQVLGFRSISGNRIFPASTNLKIRKEIGTVFKPGANFNNLNTQPHSFILQAQDPITFRYITQTGVEGVDVTDINPAIYDLNGTFTAMPATATLASIQRVYIFQDGLVRVQPGQRYFANLNDAINAINSEEFITDANISNNGLYLGAIVLTRNSTNLSNLTEAIFVPSQGTTTNGSAQTPPLGYTAENVSNKKTDLEANKTSNTFYASCKAIVDWIVARYQVILVSGTNIKTINGNSILGSGNLSVNTKKTFNIRIGLTANFSLANSYYTLKRESATITDAGASASWETGQYNGVLKTFAESRATKWTMPYNCKLTSVKGYSTIGIPVEFIIHYFEIDTDLSTIINNKQIANATLTTGGVNTLLNNFNFNIDPSLLKENGFIIIVVGTGTTAAGLIRSTEVLLTFEEL